MNIFFTTKEKLQLKEIEEKNVDDMISWKMPNVTYPVFVILFSSVCFLLFKSNDKITWAGWLNLFFNGSLAMVALNRITSLGSNLLKYHKGKEELAKINTAPLREKISGYSNILFICVVALYVYQVINNPIVVTYWLILQMIVSIVLIVFAVYMSKYAFLLQEKMLERTLGDDIRENATANKKHLSTKYGD